MFDERDFILTMIARDANESSGLMTYHPISRWMPLGAWACLVIALGTAGCSLTVGPMASSVLTVPNSSHFGFVGTAQLRKPRDYNWLLGIEEAHLAQLRPAMPGVDQWRLAALVGYSDAPTSVGGAWGWETALRVGFFRGSSGEVYPFGGLVGMKLAAPLLRLSPKKDPWESDNLIETAWLLVPEIGLNGLFPQFRSAQLEATGVLSLRLYLGSSLLP